MGDNPSDNVPFQRSQSADFCITQPRVTLSPQSSTTSLPTTSTSRSNTRRNRENSRQWSQRLHSMIREIELETTRTVNAGVQNAISISSLLNRSTSEPNPRSPTAENPDSFVINLEVSPNPVNNENEDVNHLHQHAANVLNTTTNNPEPDERTTQVVEVQQFLKNLLKYVPFLTILLAKSVYDFHQGIFIIIILFGAFGHSNATVKKETTKRQRRSLPTLGLELVYIFMCLTFIHFLFEDDLHNINIIMNLILIRTFTKPLTVWNLLWIVTITDFTLKLLTVTVKIFLTMLPQRVVEFKKRGKIYLFIEAVSQLYRSIATIQPWLYYLLESYHGPEKIVAVFLSAFYMISKGTDLMSKVKFVKNSFMKLLQNVAIGSSPSKEQIQSAGEHCPICHDEFDSPVLLQCKHIFCENCVTTWFDREQTCPLCRAKIVDDPSWRDGSTTFFMQLY